MREKVPALSKMPVPVFANLRISHSIIMFLFFLFWLFHILVVVELSLIVLLVLFLEILKKDTELRQQESHRGSR